MSPHRAGMQRRLMIYCSISCWALSWADGSDMRCFTKPVFTSIILWRFLKSGKAVCPFMAGRFGNFINGELWGRVTRPDAFWAMLFPQAKLSDLAWLAMHEADAAAHG